jgi:nucleoside-diphosphate-sugar epimerase
MRLLVLGGTTFLGRHVVAHALADGHEVTTFTRTSTVPGAEALHGDRDGNLEALRGREWDGVVDTSGYLPDVVRQAAELLRDAVQRYVFVSSISVYADFSQPVSESTPVSQEDDYGGNKARCETVVDQIYGDRSARVRPGLIVGPYDPTDRFTYWPRRIAAGGEVLAPGDPDAPVQFVDARDLAAWLVRLALQGPGGVFNATGPAQPLTMRGLFEQLHRALGGDATFTWLDDESLLAAEVEPWTGLPLWLPGDDYAGMARADIGRAAEAGLTFRPVAETARDTYYWDASEPGERPTLTREREAEILTTARGA